MQYLLIRFMVNKVINQGATKMSDRLAIASAASVLAMAVFVLFGPQTSRAPLAGESMSAPTSVSIPAELPSPARLIGLGR